MQPSIISEYDFSLLVNRILQWLHDIEAKGMRTFNGFISVGSGGVLPTILSSALCCGVCRSSFTNVNKSKEGKEPRVPVLVIWAVFLIYWYYRLENDTGKISPVETEDWVLWTDKVLKMWAKHSCLQNILWLWSSLSNHTLLHQLILSIFIL